MRQRLGLPWAGGRMVVGSSNPGAFGRALAELKRNPARTLREIASAANCTHPTVLRARRELERANARRVQAAWRALCLRQPSPVVVPCQPVMPGKDEFERGWPRESAAAVRLCTRYCALIGHCRTWALGLPAQPAGILGGLAQAERVTARRVAAQAG
jgi:hypothetical protein